MKGGGHSPVDGERVKARPRVFSDYTLCSQRHEIWLRQIGPNLLEWILFYA